jgi:hypothetical protein
MLIDVQALDHAGCYSLRVGAVVRCGADLTDGLAMNRRAAGAGSAII